MKQPVLGLIASTIGIVLALAFISLFSFPTFAGPVAFYMLCTIPFQVMAVVIWGANPSFVAKLSQPAKGLVLLIESDTIISKHQLQVMSVSHNSWWVLKLLFFKHLGGNADHRRLISKL